jgi:hypothetical protein
MAVLLNIVFGLLAGWLTIWLLEKAGAPQPIAVIIGVIVGILVFLVNLVSQLGVKLS